MNKSLKKGLLIFFSMFLVFSVAIGFGINYYLDNEHDAKMKENEEKKVEGLEEKDPELQERVNILLMGVDFLDTSGEQGQRGTRTDTIMLFSYNPKTNQSFLLSIPRDSRVPIEGHGMDKINHAHSYGGTDLSIQTITDFLGQPIHHYAKVDYTAISELVDAMGGIEIDVAQNMYYGPLNISFKKGLQTLNGDQAVKYLRYRSYPRGDEDRVQVQQGFIQVMMDELLTPAAITKLPQYIDIMNKNVETDMSKKQMIEFASLFLKSDPSKLRKEVIPGAGEYVGKVSYFLVNEPAMREQIAELFSDTPWTTEAEITSASNEPTNGDSKQPVANDSSAKEPAKEVVTPKETTKPKEPVKQVNSNTFTISKGSSATQVAKALQSQGYINDSDAFVNELVAAGKESTLQEGNFSIPKGASSSQIIGIITK